MKMVLYSSKATNWVPRKIAEIRVVVVLAVVLAVVSAGLVAKSDERASPSALSEARARWSRKSGQPICIATYGPYSGLFLVDTGSTRNIAWEPTELIESPSKDWILHDEETLLASGLVTTKVIKGIKLSAFGRRAAKSEIALIPNRTQFNGPHKLRGIIGMQEMQDFAVRLHQETFVCEPLAEIHKPYALSMGMPLDSTKAPLVQIEFPALAPKWAVLDTGLSGFMAIPDSLIQRFLESNIAAEAGTVEASNDTGVYSVKCYIIRELKLGEYVFHDVEAVTWPFGSIGIGIGFFRHFDCVFDFPEEKLLLTPNTDKWPKTIPPDASGLVFSFDENEDLVIERIHSRNAETAKLLQANDIVTRFDGKPPAEYTYFQIKDRLRQAGTSVPLRVRRGVEEFEVELRLSYPFQYPPKWGPIVEPTNPGELFEKSLAEREKIEKERQKRSLPPAGTKKP